MIQKYRLFIENKDQFDRENELAFCEFRERMSEWKTVDKSLNVALGGDSDCGEWSVVFEEGFWLVFVGERGVRFNVSAFTSVWDALSYAGFRATDGVWENKCFSALYPKLKLD